MDLANEVIAPLHSGGDDGVAPEGLGGQGVLVEPKGWYTVQFDRPIPSLDSPSAKAYLAAMRADPSRPMVAFVPDAGLPARVDVMEALRGYNLTGMLKVCDWGLAAVSPEGPRRFVVVLERPGGGRVMTGLDQPIQPMGEDEVVRGLLQPLLPTLKEFQARGATHRAIRPTNLFHADYGRRAMVLGEGVCAPPAYDQPALFETIESAMCDPSGRGNGTLANDLYALGVTLLFLLLGRNPVGDIDSDALLEHKIELGSYAALVGQYRLPLSIMEVLRGLLADDAKERWTVTDLDMWLSGRRLSPHQPKLPQRSSRPFMFQDREYFNARALSLAFARDYEAAVPVIRSKQLDSWLRRSLNDENRANALQAAVMSVASAIAGRNNEERMIARACVALDPCAPIRYQGFGVMIDGFGPALAAAMDRPDRRQLVSEMIAGRLAVHWVAAQTKPKAEDLRAVQTLERLPSMIEQTAIGYGVERCLYDLNPSEPCRSPILKNEFVTDIGGLLPALDRVVERGEQRDSVIDRHIAGFVAARSRKPIDGPLKALAAPEPRMKSLGALKLLAFVQEQANSPPVINLTRWLAQTLTPAASSFHRRERRDKLVAQLTAAGETGSVLAILKLLEDDSERRVDAAEFSRAVAEYRALGQDIDGFEASAEERHSDAMLLGQQISAAVAGVIVSIAAAIAFLLRIG